VGSFVNGMYNGKGTMLFTNGAFSTGNWLNGKLSGKGAYLNGDGALYVGEFRNGSREGQGILILKDNSFIKGGFSNDKQNGRCINVWKDGKIISDVMYTDDKRNGTGFQYESSSKTLYEGQWTNDQWVQKAKATFSSFLQKTDFIGEATSDHVLMGPTGSGGLLKDTSYYYDLKKNKRYFGLYERGYMKSGLIVSDSTRFIGQLDDDGATGYCYDFKFDKFYSEGNYQKDFLNGNILDISLAKKTVYYGEAREGYFTGKAYFFSNSNNMYCGDYVQGKFTGEGFRLDNKGICVKGTWDDGYVRKVTSITTSDGRIIPGSPKSFPDALNLIVEDYMANFELFAGDVDELEKDYLGSEDVDVYFSLLTVPGSIGKDRVAMDFEDNNFYVTRFIETADFARAKAKYEETGKLLKSVTLKNPALKTGRQLQVTVAQEMQAVKTVSKFSLSDSPREYEKFHVWLELSKNESGQYTVLVKIGEQKM
jgi:hypothetical protein